MWKSHLLPIEEGPPIKRKKKGGRKDSTCLIGAEEILSTRKTVFSRAGVYAIIKYF